MYFVQAELTLPNGNEVQLSAECPAGFLDVFGVMSHPGALAEIFADQGYPATSRLSSLHFAEPAGVSTSPYRVIGPDFPGGARHPAHDAADACVQARFHHARARYTPTVASLDKVFTAMNRLRIDEVVDEDGENRALMMADPGYPIILDVMTRFESLYQAFEGGSLPLSDLKAGIKALIPDITRGFQATTLGIDPAVIRSMVSTMEDLQDDEIDAVIAALGANSLEAPDFDAVPGASDGTTSPSGPE